MLRLVGVPRAHPRLLLLTGRVLALVLGSASLAVVGLSCSSLFHSSRLPDAELAPAVGAAAPDFALVDQRGEAVTSSSMRGQQTVLVFYRGFW